MHSNTDNSFIRTRSFRLLLLSAALVIVAGHELSNIRTPESSLMPLSGTLRNCRIYDNIVPAPTRHDYNHVSRRLQLIFYLNEYHQQFELSEIDANEDIDEQYADIRLQLLRADSVTVWIKKSERNYSRPEIFKIEGSGEEILNLENVRFKRRLGATIILVFVLACVGLPMVLYKSRASKTIEGVHENEPLRSNLRNPV